MKVELSRAQFRGKVGPRQIDVTARTGRPEAPEWAWVKAYKASQMSEDEYTRLYHAKLERVPVDHWRELWRQGRNGCGPAAATAARSHSCATAATGGSVTPFCCSTGSATSSRPGRETRAPYAGSARSPVSDPSSDRA